MNDEFLAWLLADVIMITTFWCGRLVCNMPLFLSILFGVSQVFPLGPGVWKVHPVDGWVAGQGEMGSVYASGEPWMKLPVI